MILGRDIISLHQYLIPPQKNILVKQLLCSRFLESNRNKRQRRESKKMNAHKETTSTLDFVYYETLLLSHK